MPNTAWNKFEITYGNFGYEGSEKLATEDLVRISEFVSKRV